MGLAQRWQVGHAVRVVADRRTRARESGKATASSSSRRSSKHGVEASMFSVRFRLAFTGCLGRSVVGMRLGCGSDAARVLGS